MWAIDHYEGIMALAMFTVYLYIEFKKRIAKRKKTVEESVLVNERIYPILWRMMIDYRAIRVCISQFHNGDFFYTGQSIQRNTMTHEVYLKAIGSIKHTIDNQLISNPMHKIVSRIRDTGYWAFSNVDSVDMGIATDELREKCELYSIKSASFFRITDKNDKTVGVLMVHWNIKESLDIHEVNKIKAEVKSIENIFEDAR